MTRRTWTGRHLDVTFDAEVCIHAAECLRRLPQVFDTRRRPWILPDAALPDAVREAVAHCPSGALAIVEKSAQAAAEGPPPADAPATTPVVVEIPGHGPLRVRGGPVRVVAADGTVLRESDRFSLCGCGRSATIPFCDGTHKTPDPRSRSFPGSETP